MLSKLKEWCMLLLSSPTAFVVVGAAFLSMRSFVSGLIERFKLNRVIKSFDKKVKSETSKLSAASAETEVSIHKAKEILYNKNEDIISDAKSEVKEFVEKAHVYEDSMGDRDERDLVKELQEREKNSNRWK